MASILDKWNALQNDPEYYQLSDTERKSAANLWLQQVARKTPEWQDPATRKAIVARVKGAGPQAGYGAFDAAGEGFRHGMDNTITGAAYNRASGQHAAEAPGFLDAMSSLWDGGNSLNPFSEGAGQGYTAAVTSGVPLLADPAGRALDAATAGLAGRGAAAAIEATAPVAPRAAAAIARSAPLVTAAATGAAQGGTFAALDGSNASGIAQNAALGAGLGWLLHGRGVVAADEARPVDATAPQARAPEPVPARPIEATTEGPTHVLIEGGRVKPVRVIANDGRQLVVDDGTSRTTLPADTPHLLPFESREAQLAALAQRQGWAPPASENALPSAAAPAGLLAAPEAPLMLPAARSGPVIPSDGTVVHAPGIPEAPRQIGAGAQPLLLDAKRSGPVLPADGTVVHANPVPGVQNGIRQLGPGSHVVPPEGFTAQHMGKQSGQRPPSSAPTDFAVDQQLRAMRVRLDGLDQHLANKKLKPDQRMTVQAMRDQLAGEMQQLVTEHPAGLGQHVQGMADALHASGAEDLARARANGTTLSMNGAGLGDLALGHAKQLAARLLRGAVDAAAWAREMTAQHGQAIAPHLEAIWRQAHALLTDESGQAINPVTVAANWLNHRLAGAGGLTSGADLAGRVSKFEAAIANTASFLASPEGQALDPALARRIGERLQAMRDELARMGGHLEASTAKAEAAAPAVADPTPYDGAQKAGNINLDRIETADDIKATYQAVARAYAPEIDAARRGTITREETQRLADELGLTPQQLLSRLPGQALNAEQALAARNMLASSAERLQGLAATVRGGQGSDEQRLAFRQALELHAQIQAQVAGATAEAGRALRSFQIQAKSQAARVRAIHEMLEDLGGRETIDRIAEAMEALDDPTKLNAFVRNATRPGAADKLAEYYINAILSGPPTQLGNIAGNGLVLANRLGETAMAAAVGAVSGRADRVRMGEVGQQLFGLVQSAREGIELGWHAFHTEETIGAFTNAAERNQGAIDGTFGRIVRLPSRALSGADVFFKTLVYRSELNALAYRQAASEGHAGAALNQRLGELLADPPDTMIDAARDAARYHTFNAPIAAKDQTRQSSWMDLFDPFALGDATARGLSSAKREHPALSILLPFVRTPLNIVKYAAERTPIGLLSRQVRADLAQAGPTRDLAAGKIMFGTMLGLLFYAAAKQGLLTGSGPTDPNLKKTLADKGWQPYSLHVGDHYFSITRLGPPAMIAGVAADLAQGDAFLSNHDKLGMVGEVLRSAMANFGNQTFFKGMKDLADALADPDRFAARYVGGVAGGFAPNLGNKLNQAVDPTVRETASDSFAGTVGNMVKARVPGLAQTLPQKLDSLGKPVASDASGPEALLSPFQDRTDKHNPVLDELVRLKVPVSAAGKKVAIAHLDVDLTPDQQRELQRHRGEMIQKVLGNLVTSPGYAKLAEIQKEMVVKRYMERAAHAGQQMFIGRNAHDLVGAYREKLSATRAKDQQAPRPASAGGAVR